MLLQARLIQIAMQWVILMWSKGSLKPVISCLEPVNKLEGLGEKTRRNLLEVRACAASLDLGSYVPQECPDRVTTGLFLAFCSQFLLFFWSLFVYDL